MNITVASFLFFLTASFASRPSSFTYVDDLHAKKMREDPVYAREHEARIRERGHMAQSAQQSLNQGRDVLNRQFHEAQEAIRREQEARHREEEELMNQLLEQLAKELP